MRLSVHLTFPFFQDKPSQQTKRSLAGENDADAKRARVSSPIDDPSVSNESLHARLAEADPERAAQLTPADRRKVVRSLQGERVFVLFCVECVNLFRM